jgi:hypothetical protein
MSIVLSQCRQQYWGMAIVWRMPGWLVQLATVVIAFILVVVVGGIALSIILPQVRKALFYRAVGSLVEAATAKGHERDRQTHEEERQSRVREERDERIAEEMDKLTENLNQSLSVFEHGYNAKGATGYYVEIHRALAELQREGPPEIQDQLASIGDQLASGSSFSRSWVNGQITRLNTAIRQSQSRA